MIEAIHGAGVAMAKLALDAAALRHHAIAHNLANLQSEGYVPLGVRFDGKRSELVRESTQGFAPSLDAEMVKLAQNTLHYQALVRAIGKQHAILGAAIAEGRRA
jgi:flagellar basal-body rod protein FlgB